MEEIQKTCRVVADKTLKLLENNLGWQRQYAGYAANIAINLPYIKEACREIKKRLREPFTLHLTTGDAANSTYDVNFDMCYLGQRVAQLTYGEKTITITTKGSDEANARFDCEVKLSGHKWDSEEGQKFRKHFENRTGDKTHNKELRLQSHLITEIAKTDKRIKDKALWGIQPVLLAGMARFMMRTPISASNVQNIRFGERSDGSARGIGGNIDLLTRVGIGGANTLCVVELKKEYKKQEPEEALQQGVAYATFLMELLNSSDGKYWWKIFGYNRPKPKTLNLHVALAVPIPKDGINEADKSFGGNGTCQQF